MKKKIPVLICIDVEPNARTFDPRLRPLWTGFEKTYDFFRQLRPRLTAATGSPAHFSWFYRMDSQVAEAYDNPAWPMMYYRSYLDGFQEAGDEIGLHTHAWRWDQAHQNWIADHGDQEWVNHCVRMSFEAYRSVLKRDCLSYRGGDRWLSNATLDTVRALGARFDLTLEPGQEATPSLLSTETHTGFIPDYTGVPQYPYRPSQTDFRRDGPDSHSDFWMIPLSAGVREWRSVTATPLDAVRDYMSAVQPVYMTLGMWHNPRIFNSILDRLLRGLKKPYLACVLRSDLPLCNEMRNMQHIFDSLLVHPLVSQFTFATPAEAISLLGHDAASSVDESLVEHL